MIPGLLKTEKRRRNEPRGIIREATRIVNGYGSVKNKK